MPIDVMTTHQDLQTLADRVEPSDKALSARLSDLSQAIVGGASTDTWASTNVRDVISPDYVAARMSRDDNSNKWIDGLEIVRNGLVLLPVAVTWFGIWQAASHYQTYLATNPDEARHPFLFLWQQAFGGTLHPWLTLSHLALIDSLLLGLIFFLTLLVHSLAYSHSHRNLVDRERDRGAVDSLLADATLILADHRRAQPGNFVQRFEKMGQGLLDEIGRERQRLDALAQKREKELGDLSVFSAGLTNGAKEMLLAAQALQQANVNLIQGIHALTTPMSNLASGHQHLVQVMGNLSNQLVAVVNEQRTVVGQQGQLVQAVHDNEVQLARLHDSQRDTSKDMRSAIEALNTSSANTADVGTEIARVASHIATKQTEFLSALERERAAQANLSAYVSQAAIAIESSLHEVNQYAVTLHGIAVDLSDLTRMLPALPESLQRELAGLLNAHAIAAADISAASRSLVTASTMIEQTLNGKSHTKMWTP